MDEIDYSWVTVGVSDKAKTTSNTDDDFVIDDDYQSPLFDSYEDDDEE